MEHFILCHVPLIQFIAQETMTYATLRYNTLEVGSAKLLIDPINLKEKFSPGSSEFHQPITNSRRVYRPKRLQGILYILSVYIKSSTRTLCTLWLYSDYRTKHIL
jgi:hypothetical protein